MKSRECKKTTGTLKEMKHDQKIICLWSCSCTGTDAGTGFWKNGVYH